MKTTARVCIDHATIYCKDKAPLNKLFDSLGFYSKNNMHYMTDNSYFELYQPAPDEGPYAFFRSDAGLHSFIFWSDDIDNCYDRLTGAGYVTAMPLSNFSRPADHGEPGGEAEFRGFYMQTPLLPIGETAVVQQMTPQFIYPAKRYPHPNGVVAMDKMYLCLADAQEQAQAGETLQRFCDVIGEGRPVRGCITELELGNADDFEQTYGVRVDLARSCCTGIRLLTTDMDAVRRFAAESGLKTHEKDGALVVDATEQANLFLVFAAR